MPQYCARPSGSRAASRIESAALLTNRRCSGDTSNASTASRFASSIERREIIITSDGRGTCIARRALGAQFHQSALDAIPCAGIVDLLGDGGRTRPELCRLRVRTKRRRTVRSLLQVLERPLEVPTAREVKGEQFELVVQRVAEGLLVGGGHEAVELASASSGQR